MTEAEALELIIMCSDNALTSFGIYVTIAFAYLTVAYLVGSRLSTLQTLVLSGLYVFASGAVISNMYLLIRTWGELRAGVTGGIAVMDRIPLWNQTYWAIYPTSACVIGILVGLYLMWNVRHPKKI